MYIINNILKCYYTMAIRSKLLQTMEEPLKAILEAIKLENNNKWKTNDTTNVPFLFLILSNIFGLSQILSNIFLSS